jgi:hypothetical protein
MSAETRNRILIALTETSPVPDLWRVAMRVVQEGPAEIVTLYLEDDTWRRAASLPFTREVSRTGKVSDFSLTRAEEIHRETINRARELVARLAAEAEVSSEFEVLQESDAGLVHNFLRSRDVLVAASQISERPIYVELTKLDCRILLVDVLEEDDTPESS